MWRLSERRAILLIIVPIILTNDRGRFQSHVVFKLVVSCVVDLSCVLFRHVEQVPRCLWVPKSWCGHLVFVDEGFDFMTDRILEDGHHQVSQVIVEFGLGEEFDWAHPQFCFTGVVLLRDEVLLLRELHRVHELLQYVVIDLGFAEVQHSVSVLRLCVFWGPRYVLRRRGVLLLVTPLIHGI